MSIAITNKEWHLQTLRHLRVSNGDLQYPKPWMKYLKASITLAGCGEQDEKY